MLRRWVVVGSLVAGCAFAGCLNAPVTGRRQIVAIPEQEEIRLGNDAWRQVLSQEQPSRNMHYADLVEQVGSRIAAAAGRDDYEWEFRVFASDKANAFALPGGKVAVYEGILPVCQNEAGLAVVMSHEIGHVLARHGGERMTQQGLAKVGGGLLGRTVKDRPADEQQRWMNAYGAASTYGVLLPYSRTHESEADSIGLTLMAKAGYDPSEAPRFWERFAKLSGPKPPEFLSTHPSDAHRASQLRSLLPQALAIYNAAPEKLGTGIAIAAPPASAAGNEIQLAGHEETIGRDKGVMTAGYEEVGVEEFLPPIQRGRSLGPDASQPLEFVEPKLGSGEPAPGEPAPFPDAAHRVIDAGGWAPADK